MDSTDTRAAQLFLAHHSFVKGLALRFAPWPGLTEDIVQQVFLEFIGKEKQWNLEKDIRPLLGTMTRNVALRHWRQRTRELPEVVGKLAEHIRQLAEAQDAPSRYDDEVQALRRCMEQLPQKSRQLLELYYHADVPTPQIASRMEMNTGTVCRALSRLREKLRGCVQGVLAGGPAHV